ncbi:MAG: nucleoside triphosphate pyrophosphohydrolase [Candidatus Blackburnbacteria bacterium]|nr:nucleoside triphosphate pyrophosphohydrolase [Candidatus Blackburnbacteria bacterium]
MMAEFRFDKLVRDGIPGKIESNGGTVISRTLSPTEMLDAARAKLLEEAGELNAASGEDVSGELADIKERAYIETVEVPHDSEWASYYRSQPDRYPEVK